MTILLVNDDGYDADGILAMERALKERGHRVLMSAPKTQMSGKSHAMTISSDIEITRFAPDRYHFTGTPVDCILYTKRYERRLFDEDPDLVISGINDGYNIATDIMYSGTCGAAREAVFCGWKAIAVSCEGRNFDFCAETVADSLDRLYPILDDKSFININFPEDFNGEMKPCIPGDVRYLDRVLHVKTVGDTDTVRIEDVIRDERHVPGYVNDLEVVESGCASVSSVSVFSHSDPEGLRKLEKIL